VGTSGSLLGCATSGASSATTATAAGASEKLEAAKPPAPLKLLILGGTGFLGPQLVDAARAHGHSVTLFNRGKTRPGLFGPEIEQLQGDRDGKLQALEGRKWDAVIDTSGYVPRIVKASAELLAPNVGHYVFISTISVYAQDLTGHIDETSRLEQLADPTTEEVRKFYGGLKALCEQAAETAMPGRVTNIRPGLIVGPDDPTDRFTYWPVRADRGGEILAPGDGKDPVQYVDVRDLAAWTIEVVERKVFGVFNALGFDTPVTTAEMIESCRQVTSTSSTVTWVPTAFLEEQKVSPWSDMPVWIPREGGGIYGNARAREQGLKFRPLTETAKDTLSWWKSLPPAAPPGEKEHPFNRTARARAGLSPEREREVLAAWAAKQQG
jgi:2'-hydroxyisoflavone reductase